MEREYLNKALKYFSIKANVSGEQNLSIAQEAIYKALTSFPNTFHESPKTKIEFYELDLFFTESHYFYLYSLLLLKSKPYKHLQVLNNNYHRQKNKLLDLIRQVKDHET